MLLFFFFFFFFLLNHKNLLPIIKCGTLVSRKVVVSACCFRVDGSLCSTRESNELFLDAASVISSPEFIEVSVAGKHFCIKTSLKIMLC